MNIEALRALVEQRCSIRGYDESRQVSDETVRAILDWADGLPPAATASRGSSSSWQETN